MVLSLGLADVDMLMAVLGGKAWVGKYAVFAGDAMLT